MVGLCFCIGLGYSLPLGGSPLQFPWFLYLYWQCRAMWLEPPQTKRWAHVSDIPFSWQTLHPRFGRPGGLVCLILAGSWAWVTELQSIFILVCMVAKSAWTAFKAVNIRHSSLYSLVLSLTVISKVDIFAGFVLPEKLKTGFCRQGHIHCFY